MSGGAPHRWVAAAAFAAVVVLAACGGSRSHELTGYVREPAARVDGVAIPDLSRGGAPRALRAEPGHVLLVYFGFTACPDACPTTLADVRTALDILGDEAELIDLAMATIDPGRDLEVLPEYVQSFVADAHALGTEDDLVLRSVAEPFGATYRVEADEAGDVQVAHSTQLYAVGDDGVLRVTWPFGFDAQDLARDLELLLREASA